LAEIEFNTDFLRTEAKRIRNSIKDIRKYSCAEVEEFLQEPTLIDSTKYKLLIAIEVCIAICNHFASRMGEQIPNSYSECFEILYKLNIITEDLTQKLIKMAKFRNLLIHIYWEVDDNKIYEITKKDLGDMEEFLEQIGQFLKEKL
jgi:uncharacterized protein YutE (UPF0331/DUF86 family)